AVVRFPHGLSKAEQVKAVVMGVAEADAWAFRKDARRDYADLIHRVKRGFSDEQAQAVMKAYAHLRLLQFFNSAEAQPAIDALPGDLKGAVQEMAEYYARSKRSSARRSRRRSAGKSRWTRPSWRGPSRFGRARICSRS